MDAVAEVLPALVQEQLRKQWTWLCLGCGHILFRMQGSVIESKCGCNKLHRINLIDKSITAV